MYEYKAKVARIIDGDTIDVDIWLGFDVVLPKQRIRLFGIDTPESRTRNKKMCDDGYAVPYHGGNKDELEGLHMANKQKLIQLGVLEE